MNISKIVALYALLTDGVTGIVKYVLKAINTQVLGKIKDKETASKYLKDAQATYTLVRTVLDNHADDISDEKKKRGEAILAAIEEFTKALEDFKVEETELDKIIAKINTAIDAFKKTK